MRKLFLFASVSKALEFLVEQKAFLIFHVLLWGCRSGHRVSGGIAITTKENSQHPYSCNLWQWLLRCYNGDILEDNENQLSRV